jgi:hypothetical protein
MAGIVLLLLKTDGASQTANADCWFGASMSAYKQAMCQVAISCDVGSSTHGPAEIAVAID